MPFNLIISDSTGFEGSQAANSTFLSISNLGGIGSFVAVPFMATDNWKINRVFFSSGTVAGASGLGIMVGIGTWDDKIPSFNAGFGNSLNFSSSSIKTSSFGNVFPYFESIPEFTVEAGKKYFFGMQTVARGASSQINMIFYPLSNSFDDTGNYRIYRQGNTGIVRQYSAFGSAFNWGYDSGTANTVWYNPQYGGHACTNGDQQRYSLFSSTGQSQFGFSFYMDSPFNAVEMEEFGFSVRTLKWTSNYTGFGITYNVVLYDSDGTTALTACTQTYVPTFAGFRKVFMPLKYTLQSNKVYYFTFHQESTNSSNDFVVAYQYPSQIMSGNSVTTYIFRKISPSSAPVITNINEQLLYELNISKIYGSKQGSIGNDFRIYNPATGQYG